MPEEKYPIIIEAEEIMQRALTSDEILILGFGYGKGLKKGVEIDAFKG